MNAKISETLKSILFVATIFVFAIFFRSFVAVGATVDGMSMYSNFSNGDRLIADRLTYHFEQPERFDVLIFNLNGTSDSTDGYYLIKRIIGLPGESVRIDDSGNIYINNKILSESYGYEPIKYAGTAANEIILGPDEYFVLGDNRNNSVDSRFEEIGVVKKEQIVGRALLRIFPFDTAGFVK